MFATFTVSSTQTWYVSTSGLSIQALLTFVIREEAEDIPTRRKFGPQLVRLLPSCTGFSTTTHSLYANLFGGRFIGGWWVRPSNWKSNTAIAAAGIAIVAYATWSVSAEHEVRFFHSPTPSTGLALFRLERGILICAYSRVCR